MLRNTAILTYHSQNIRGRTTQDNDHVALSEDLERLHETGLQVISLGHLLDQLEGKCTDEDMAGSVCLTFDDGCDFDVRDINYPGIGVQRSLLGIMQDFIDRHGKQAQPGLHATSFVIASEQARRLIDSRSLFGYGWISDDWWSEVSQGRLISIGNHGWDHNHPDLAPQGKKAAEFTSVNSDRQCEQQVIHAAEFIASKTGSWPEMFAYPFGESSAFIRERFFPRRISEHRSRGALGTQPGWVTRDSNRWNLPRFVCGRDWQSPDQLLGLLQGDQIENLKCIQAEDSIKLNE